jgi:hypothetical protein
MSRSLRILLLDERVDLSLLRECGDKAYDALICLFWAAPSTRRALSDLIGGPCYTLADLVGSDMAWGEKAYRWTAQVIHSGPCYMDTPWRTYLAEVLHGEFRLSQLLMMVADYVETLKRDWSAASVIVEGYLDGRAGSLLTEIFSNYSAVTYHPLAECFKTYRGTGRRSHLMVRLRERLHEACLTGDWRSQATDMMEWMDKTFQWRASIGRWTRRPEISTGGVTFFSSYLNNSRALSSFVDVMPGPVNWVLTNDSSRRGLPKGNSCHSWIWQFGPPPSVHENVRDDEVFKDELRSTETDFIERWVALNPVWQRWRSTELSLLTTLTRCWESYLEKARPRLIVMANQWGIEGWVSHLARRRGIPLLQIMHGILGGYLYTRTPVLSDAMVVPGEFWRTLWPSDERQKIIAYNTTQKRKQTTRKISPSKRRLTFFSAPLRSISYYNFSEFMDGFARIFEQILANHDHEIHVRVHPLENPADFVSRWKFVAGSVPANLKIGKHEPLESVLAETNLALMFRSTVMLNCLENSIPVIIPGWVDFGWNNALLEVPGVYLARSFSDLDAKIRQWLDHPPEMGGEVTDYFVRPAGEGEAEFTSLIRDLCKSAC